jgi:hypothetical protein
MRLNRIIKEQSRKNEKERTMLKSEYAGKVVKLALKVRPGFEDAPGILELQGQEMVVEDWWLNVYGESWMWAKGNPAALKYALRTGFACDVPTDDNVLYGKVGLFGHLVHVSEVVPLDVNG